MDTEGYRMDHVIEMKNVSRSFHDKKAVDGVSFTIKRGSITAVLGPNGAGKTTTLSMLLGLLEPTEGSVQVFGLPPKDARDAEDTADRILLFSRGALVADGSPEEIKARIVSKSVSFLPLGDPAVRLAEEKGWM